MNKLKYLAIGMLIGAFALPFQWIGEPVQLAIGQTVTVDSTQSPIVVNAMADLADLTPSDGQSVIIKTGTEKGLWYYDKDSATATSVSVLNGPGSVGRFLVINNDAGSVAAATAITAAEITNDSLLELQAFDGSSAKSLTLAELKKTANVVTAANVAALYALTYAIDNQLYHTLGYTTEGIGANQYRYDSGSAAAVDYGFVLDGIGGDGTGTGTGRFIAVDQTVADVTKFGAIGNGVADDTAEIQATFDAIKAKAIAATNKPCPAFFPPGVYLVSSTITLPRIPSPGSGVTNGKWLCSGYGAQIKTVTDTTIFEDLGDAHDHLDYWSPVFCGFDFLGSHVWPGSQKTSQIAISVKEIGQLTIRDCTFYQWTKCIVMDWCIQAVVESCRFHASVIGVEMTGGGTYQQVRDCRFYMFEPDAIGINGGGSFHATNVIFEGSVCKYPIVAASDGGQSNHVLIDHMHYECAGGCLRLFKVPIDRDYAFEARSVQIAMGNYLLFDASGSDSFGELIIRGINGVSPGIQPWNSATTYGASKRVIEYTSVGTVTVDDATDIFTLNAHGMTENQLVTFTTTDTMPTGLSANTVYYVIQATTNTFRLRSGSGQNMIPVNCTSAGTGTLTVRKRGNVYVALASTTGDTPSTSPLKWKDEGSGAAMIGLLGGSYKLLDVKTTSVFPGWTPDNLWTNSSQWDISGANGLPYWLVYEGFDATNSAGYVSLGGFNGYAQIPDGDTAPAVGSRQFYRTENTAPTSITTFTGLKGSASDPTTGRQTKPLYVVVDDNNTTFVHSSAFRLMGGVDYTATLGDILVFMRTPSSGNKWIQVGGSF